jgi:hypothetical protein
LRPHYGKHILLNYKPNWRNDYENMGVVVSEKKEDKRDYGMPDA